MTDVLCTGFVRIISNPGPDTLSIAIQRPEHAIHFALSRDECERLAAILTKYAESA